MKYRIVAIWATVIIFTFITNKFAFAENAGGGFQYRNLSFKHNAGIAEVRGIMTNLSGHTYKSANFIVTCYDHFNRQLGFATFTINNFSNGQSLNFKTSVNIPSGSHVTQAQLNFGGGQGGGVSGLSGKPPLEGVLNSLSTAGGGALQNQNQLAFTNRADNFNQPPTFGSVQDQDALTRSSSDPQSFTPTSNIVQDYNQITTFGSAQSQIQEQALDAERRGYVISTDVSTNFNQPTTFGSLQSDNAFHVRGSRFQGNSNQTSQNEPSWEAEFESIQI